MTEASPSITANLGACSLVLCFNQCLNLGHLLFWICRSFSCYGAVLGNEKLFQYCYSTATDGWFKKARKQVTGKGSPTHVTNLISKCVNLWSMQSSEEIDEILLKPKLRSQSESFSSTILKPNVKILLLCKHMLHPKMLKKIFHSRNLQIKNIWCFLMFQKQFCEDYRNHLWKLSILESYTWCKNKAQKHF